MTIEPFHLERWFAQHEFSTPILLGASDCETVSVGQLLDLDPGARDRFEALRLGYTHSRGSAALRDAIADSYADTIRADDILVHAAGVEVITTLCLALLGKGDRALVQMPCYQVLRTAPILAGAQVDLLHTRAADGWGLDPDRVEAALTPQTRLVALNSPHNPTGALIPRARLERIAELCAERGIVLLVDEAYRGTRYPGADDEPPPIDEASAAELGPHVVTLGLVSKGYGLPGLRIGWLVARDRRLRKAVELAKDYTTICAPAPSEFLAEIALRNRAPLLTRTRERLRTHLGLLRGVLRRHDALFDWVEPQAGPITFPTLRPDFAEALRGGAGPDGGPGEDPRNDPRSAPRHGPRDTLASTPASAPAGTPAGAPLAAPPDTHPDATPASAGLILAERLRAEAGVLVIPGTLFDALDPAIRIGFGRADFPQGLDRLDEWLTAVS